MAYTQLWLLFHTTGINFLVMRASQDYSIFYPVLVENKDKYHIFPKTFRGRGTDRVVYAILCINLYQRICSSRHQFYPTSIYFLPTKNAGNHKSYAAINCFANVVLAFKNISLFSV